LKVSIDKIESNPHRDPVKYPVDEDKVARLMESYSKTGFWNNLIARPHPDKEGFFQIGYGQHRLTACRRMGITEIDLEVKDMSDLDMLRVLVDENEEFNHTRTTKYIIENVEAAKKFIESHIDYCNGDYDKLDDWCAKLFDNKQGFDVSMGKGGLVTSNRSSVGWKIISNFLGDSWTKDQIRVALLSIPEDEEVEEDFSREVSEKLSIPKVADEASSILLSEHGKIAFPTNEAQKEIVEEVLIEYSIEKETPSSKISGREIKERLVEKVEEKMNIVLQSKEPLNDLTDYTEPEREFPNTVNRKYFKKVLKGFNQFTVPPGEIPWYGRAMAHTDYCILHLLAKDILSRLSEYQSTYGFGTNISNIVYDFYDEVSNEELEALEKWVEEEGIVDNCEMSVEEWCCREGDWVENMEKLRECGTIDAEFRSVLDSYLENTEESAQEEA
jgi:hypothetical protein